MGVLCNMENFLESIFKEGHNYLYKKLEMAFPIVFGNKSRAYRIRKAKKFIHQWTVFFRCPGDHDLSPLIQKVVFHLHNSFPHPIREVYGPEFALTGFGWGEFAIKIEIVFHKDASVKNFSLIHDLKLFTSKGEIKKKKIFVEMTNEIVFIQPNILFYKHICDTFEK